MIPFIYWIGVYSHTVIPSRFQFALYQPAPASYIDGSGDGEGQDIGGGEGGPGPVHAEKFREYQGKRRMQQQRAEHRDIFCSTLSFIYLFAILSATDSFSSSDVDKYTLLISRIHSSGTPRTGVYVAERAKFSKNSATNNINSTLLFNAL